MKFFLVFLSDLCQLKFQTYMKLPFWWVFRKKQKKQMTWKKSLNFFNLFSNEHGHGKIKITKNEFSKKEELFNRGLRLAALIREKFNFTNESVSWSGIENHKEDSSDIYVGGVGISLKDSSRIIRNTGFSQFLEVFCPNRIRDFNDPYFEFAPKLSAKYLHAVIRDCSERDFIKILDSHIYIDNQKRGKFDGYIEDFMNANLSVLLNCINKKDIKSLIKNFSRNGSKEKLFFIRKSMVDEVSNKIVAFLREGLYQNHKNIEEKLKYVLQFRDKEKIFGFSSKKFNYVGKILKKKDVGIFVQKISTEESKLTSKTMGLQINFYTDINISFPFRTEKIILQNQLRYKHRTFTCAPEANFHLLQYEDWKKLYPNE